MAIQSYRIPPSYVNQVEIKTEGEMLNLLSRAV